MPEIPQKKLKDLTEAEKKKIIDLYANGGSNPYYEVRTYKNGSSRICYRHAEKEVSTPTKAQSARDNTQFMIEKLMEVTERLTRTEIASKKANHRYKKLKKNIYVDEEEVGEESTPIRNEKAEKPVVEVVEEESVGPQRSVTDKVSEILTNSPQEVNETRPPQVVRRARNLREAMMMRQGM